MVGTPPLHKPSTHSPSNKILHQAELPSPFSLQTTSPCRGDFGGLKQSITSVCSYANVLFTQYSFKKDLLFWLLALSLCSRRAKPTQHRYLRTGCSFKCNFHSNREIHVLVMTAQKLKDFPFLEYDNIHILTLQCFLYIPSLETTIKFHTADFPLDTNCF